MPREQKWNKIHRRQNTYVHNGIRHTNICRLELNYQSVRFVCCQNRSDNSSMIHFCCQGNKVGLRVTQESGMFLSGGIFSPFRGGTGFISWTVWSWGFGWKCLLSVGCQVPHTDLCGICRGTSEWRSFTAQKGPPPSFPAPPSLLLATFTSSLSSLLSLRWSCLPSWSPSSSI